jgi:hypothetical protein
VTHPRWHYLLILLHTYAHSSPTAPFVPKPFKVLLRKAFYWVQPLFHNFGSPAAHFGLIGLSQFLQYLLQNKKIHFAYNLTLVLAKAGNFILQIESLLKITMQLLKA